MEIIWVHDKIRERNVPLDSDLANPKDSVTPTVDDLCKHLQYSYSQLRRKREIIKILEEQLNQLYPDY